MSGLQADTVLETGHGSVLSGRASHQHLQIFLKQMQEESGVLNGVVSA